MTMNADKITSQAPVTCLGQTASTNDDAARLGREGAPHLSCVVAEDQTAGRGRRGRKWFTFPHTSIAASFVVRQGGGDVLPLVVSLAVAEALRDATGLDCRIKWPNDVLINGRKVAGMLVEYAAPRETPGQGASSPFHVVGIGLNVNTPEGGVPEAFAGTTLELETGRTWPREVILTKIISFLSEKLEIFAAEGWQALEQPYIKLCDTLGSPVEWYGEDRSVIGMAEALTPTGALRIRSRLGVEEVSSGMIVRQGRDHI